MSGIAAIETNYRGYLFRSRLEAKYAVFFDLCGWRWSYEPTDFNGWIPDFAIGERPTFVEVKPFFQKEKWKPSIDKIVASGCQEPVVLLGVDPTWLEDDGQGAPVFGWILDCFESEIRELFNLNFGFTEGNGLLGLCSLEGSWLNCVWNNPDPARNKWDRVQLSAADREGHLVARWAEASNTSRWIPLRSN